MKLTCPACGALYSLDALLGNEGAREAVQAALLLPAPLGGHMIRYIALFRPLKRQLSLDRVANLINELLPMITDARISRNGNICSAPQDYWRMAIDQMLAKRAAGELTLPLKSHGYLLAVIEGYSVKADQRQEQQHEDQLAGRTPVGGKTTAAQPSAGEPKQLEVSQPRSVMPQSVKDILKSREKNHAE